MLARTLLFMENPARAMTRRRRGPRGAAGDREDLDLALRAIRIVGVFFGVADPAHLAELEAWRRGRAARGRGRRR